MTKEVLQGKSEGKVTELVLQQELPGSESLLRFQKMKVTNLQVKEEMARELAAMELPEEAVNQILRLEEDEVVF